MERTTPSPLQRRLWYAVLALAFLLVSLNAYRLLLTRRADPDQFWHVATGRYVLQHRTVPHVDPFSWYGSERRARWVAHEWLFGVVAYGLHSLGGFRALYAFTALLDGALFLLSYSLALVRSKRQALSLLVATLAVIGTYPNLAPRPQMFTFCLVLVIALLGEKKRLWWALPVVLLGANLHGGAYPIYLIVLAFYAIPGTPLVLAAAAPLVLVNPNGVGLLTYALGVTNPDAAFIQEFRPTALIARPMNLAVYLGVLVVLWGQRLKLKDGVFVFLLVLLSMSAVRQVAFFYVLVLPILAPYVPFGRAEESAEAPSAEVVPRASPAMGLFDLAPVVALAAAVAFMGSVVARMPLDVSHGYPQGAVEYVKANSIRRVYNVWGDGGFLIYSGVPPLIDGRGDPFMAAGNHGVDMAHDYLTSESLSRDPRWFFDTYGIRTMIMRKSMILYRALLHDPAISTIYEDEAYAVLRYTPSGAAGSTLPGAP